MIKLLPQKAQEMLIDSFNTIKDTCILPPSWSTIEIVPLKKPNKPDENISSYRPISLISCVAKTFNIIIKNRLEWIVESKSILHPHCIGFRKGRSTIDAIQLAQIEINKAFQKKKNSFRMHCRY